MPAPSRGNEPWVTSQTAERPPGCGCDLLPIPSSPQTLPDRKELGEREPCPLAALRGKKSRDFYMLDLCRCDSPTTSLLPPACPLLCGSGALTLRKNHLRIQGGPRPMGTSELSPEPKSTALHALPNLLHSSPFHSAGARHQWSHIPVGAQTRV